MDIYEAAAVVVSLVVGLVVVVQLLKLLRTYTDGVVLAKQTVADSVADMNRRRAEVQWGKASKKTGKKKAASGDDEDEPWEPLIEQLRPYQAVVKGYVQSKGWPVDVDKVFAYDEDELNKLDNLAEMALKKGQAKLPAGNDPTALPEWFKQ